MFANLTLHRYHGRQFLISFFFTMLVLASLVLLLDGTELLRRTASHPHINLYHTLQLIFYKLWETIHKIIPFAICIATISFLNYKIINNENIALRAAGTSPLQILIAPFICMLFIGLFNLTIFNYAVTQFSHKFDNLQQHLFGQNTKQLSRFKNAIWLYQKNTSNRKTIIHAQSASENGQIFYDVEAFLITNNNIFLKKIAAAEASLKDGFWHFNQATITSKNATVIKQTSLSLETELTPDNVKKSLSAPENLPFWNLLQFTQNLEKTQSNTITYRLYLQKTIAEPLFHLAILLITAGLLLRVKRRQDTHQIICMNILALFATLGLYFLNNLMYVWGLNGYLPINSAAWATPIAACFTASGLIMHLEKA